MPQKKNADSLELIRGKSGRIFGRVSNENAIFSEHLALDLLWLFLMIFVSRSIFSLSSSQSLFLAVCWHADDLEGMDVFI